MREKGRVAQNFDPLELRIWQGEQRLLRSWSCPNLSAPHWRLYWNADPGAELVLGDDRLLMDPDRLYLIAPETPFSTRLRRPARHFFVHFTIALRYGSERRIFSARVDPEFRFPLEAACRALEADEGLEASLLLHALASRALALLPARSFQHRRLPESVEKALACMQRRLAEALPNPALAREAGMATNAFVRLFRQATGDTPQRRLARERVDRACILLANTRLPIEQIACDCGFANRYHFSRVFKRFRGLGPAAYRKRNPQPGGARARG